jgi:DDE superfamily endonuclease
VKEKRRVWAERMSGLDPKKLVFIDETGANTKMTRRYGRAPVGQRVVGRVPHGHWKTTTFVAALRSDGLAAPMVIDGAMNGDLFVAYAKQVLVPTLRPGDVVVMDNLASHKRVAAVRAIEGAGLYGGVSAAVQPGLQPDRVGVRQDQGQAPRRRVADRRSGRGLLRRRPRRVHQRRVPKLHPTRRIHRRYGLTESALARRRR